MTEGGKEGREKMENGRNLLYPNPIVYLCSGKDHGP